jgi:hypothetical protein
MSSSAPATTVADCALTAPPSAVIGRAGQPQYQPFLKHNAEQAWRNRRAGDGLIGPDWNAPAPETALQSLTAGAGAALLQIVAL